MNAVTTNGRRPRAGRFGGFTMIELLVTVTIIAMLAAVVLGALEMARESARDMKTRALISKIDRFVIERYESYRTRRIPLTRAQMADIAIANDFVVPAVDSYALRYNALAIPRVRLSALRDLMRMEMPDRWSDVRRGPVFLLDPSTGGPLVSPTLRERYLQALAGVPSPTAQWESAECLYQIVMSCPGAKDNFRDSDFGDADDDGLREFHDGWGNPIQFIRWPTGFVDHYNLMVHNDLDGPLTSDSPERPAGREPDPVTGIREPTLDWSTMSDRHTGDPEAEPDPFDPSRVIPRLVDLWVETTSAGRTPALGVPPMGLGYAVYPLIYSAGPDGRYEINQGMMEDPTDPSQLIRMTYWEYRLYWGQHWQSLGLLGVWDLNPYFPDLNDGQDENNLTRRFVGQPRDETGYFVKGQFVDESVSRALDHYDNIHNHRIEAEQ